MCEEMKCPPTLTCLARSAYCLASNVQTSVDDFVKMGFVFTRAFRLELQRACPNLDVRDGRIPQLGDIAYSERAARSVPSVISIAKFVIALALLITFAPLEAMAQEEPSPSSETRSSEIPRNFLFADLSLGVLALGYGYDVTDWLSLQLVAQYYAPWYILGDRVRGVGGELRAVFIPFRADEHALIVVEGVRLAAAFGPNDDVGLAYSLRTSLGYQLTIDWFRFQIAFGFQHHAIEGLEPASSFSGLYPTADLLVGVVL